MPMSKPKVSIPRTVRILSAMTAVIVVAVTHAGVLPEDRADALYHSFNGGGVKVDGPSLLVRKKFGETISASANYYVDMVTSASIDVRTSGASEYKEKRTQYSAGMEYLRGKTTYNLDFINSKESDYVANTASVGVSEDMFGDLTTISLGYTRAWDQVYKNIKDATSHQVVRDVGFVKKDADHRSYRIGYSQIVTKHLIMGLNYESQANEGYLQNPYRSINFLQSGRRAAAPEVYPGTRTTNAVAIDARYYLPYRAAVHANYRHFSDTWGIVGHTGEIGYTHPWHAWTFDAAYRYHKQKAADFFSDLFPRANAQNFMARDRNLAEMHDQSIHLGISYDVAQVEAWTHSWFNKGSVNLFYDRAMFDFANFRDARYSDPSFTTTPVAAGTEPLYKENANIVRFFISLWF
jgi:hypothetical protein